MSISLDESGLAVNSITVRLGANKAEAKAIAPASRSDAAPARGTHVLSVIVPTPAANHAVRPRGRARAIHYYENSENGQVADAR